MKVLVFIMVFTVHAVVLFAQQDVVYFLQAPELSTQLSQKYLEPMAKMNNKAVNTGWYHTAKPSRYLGYNFSFSMSSTSTPATNRGFYLTGIKDFDTYYTLKDGSSPITPNVAGTTDDIPLIKAKENGREIQMPNGNSLDHIFLPMFSAGIGLPYNTEFKLRFMPKIENGDLGKVMQYGISVKHSLKEYISSLDEIPALSLSLMGGYSVIKNDIQVVYPASISENQLLKGISRGYTGRVLIGMDVVVFSAFMGIGYGVSSTEYALKGNYYVGDIERNEEEANPILVNYNYGQIEFNFGINAKVGAFDLFVDYSPGEYHTFNFGLGFSVR